MQNTEFFLKNTNKNESSNIIWEEIGSQKPHLVNLKHAFSFKL